MKLLHIFIFLCIFYAYGQDNLSSIIDSNIDSLYEKDTKINNFYMLEKIYYDSLSQKINNLEGTLNLNIKIIDSILLNQPDIFTNAKKADQYLYNKYNEQKEIKMKISSIRNKLIYLGDSSNLILQYKNKIDSLEKTFNKNISDIKEFPFIYNFHKKTVKNKHILLGAGISLITTGAFAILFTIIDVNCEREHEYKFPTYNSKGVATGTEKGTIKYKPEWSAIHTVTMTISTGMLLSGIILIKN